MGRQNHNSKYELYKSDEIEKEYYSSIISKCEVLKFDQFIKKVLLLKDKKISGNSNLPTLENTYFVRQKYSDDNYVPDLPTTCFCDQIFNPDKQFIQCKECRELIHVECFFNEETKECFSCKSNIENQLQNSSSSIQQTTTNNIPAVIGVKRNRTEVPEQEMRKSYQSQPYQIQTTQIPSNPMQNSSLLLEETKVKHLEDPKISYPNLSEERRKNLTALIEKMEKESNPLLSSFNKTLSLDEKNRKGIKDKICYSLVLFII